METLKDLWPFFSIVLQYGYLALGLAMGVILHFLTELKNLNAAGVYMTPKEYWAKNPYSTATSIVGAIISYMILVGTNEMNIVYYIMNGYICDSVPKLLGERTGKDLANRVDKMDREK